MVVHRVFGPHQIGGHHRGDETGHKQREEDGEGDRQAELDEVLARDAGMKETGTKTAMMVKVVAMTARPISSAASIAAR